MNQKNQKKMDKKKTKRRKSNAGKRQCRAEPEEKPKTVEVMNEKEKQDRLEAASVLSSLMFFPPKSSEENETSGGVGKNDLVTPSQSMTQFTVQPSTSGIPTTSQPTYLVQRGGRVGAGSATLPDNAITLKNSMILAQLQSQLNLALKNRNVQPVFHPQEHVVLTENKSSSLVKPGLTSKYVTNDKVESQNVPLTVLKQNLTVNKNVAKALRQVVSNNKLKAEIPQTETTQKKVTENTDTTAVCVTAPTDEREKMECESLPSSQRKIGSSDTNLPLKKRRLIGMNDDSLTTSDLNLGSSALGSNLDTLTSARQIENILQMAKDYPAPTGDSAMSLVSNLSQPKLQSGEGYRPVQFDPRTSLMVLSDLKFALTPDEDGDLPIHIAVVHENIELVKKFIDIMAISGKTVDRFNKLQQTPLHLAVLVNQPEIISVLLTAGANPNLQDRNGYTSIHISVNKEQTSCLDTLFRESKYPVSLNTRDYEGYYPLHSCVELDNIEMMISLVQHGADKDCQDGKAGRSVLFYAVEHNRGNMVQYLLDQGATPDLQNYASVTPMMTAQAASYENIVTCLNKALDIGNKYEDSYIPSKKVPIAKIPSKSAQIINKDKTGRVSINSDIPLIYEEYESGSHSVSDDFKKEPLSRQSSVSSPIDLSMRHNIESPQLPVEMSIRGKPGRRKTKKEFKNHKDKHQNKSMVKEKHASVVAALERSMFADKSYALKADGKTDYRSVEPYIKVEANDTEDVEMKSKEEREENVDVEKDRTKSTSQALSNFILNLRPEQTKYLVDKVKQQLSVQRSENTSLALNATQRYIYTAKNPDDNIINNVDNSAEHDMERMHQDHESIDAGGGKDTSEYDLKDETSTLTNKDEYSEMIVSENERDVAQTEEIPMEDDLENRTEIITKENTKSPVTAIHSPDISQSPEADHSSESDSEEITVYFSNAINHKDTRENSPGSPSEKTGLCSNNILSNRPKSCTSNDSYIEDKSCIKAHKETMSKDTPEFDEGCVNKKSDDINEKDIPASTLKNDKLEPSQSKQLVSQISQESATSSSLHGSQGFEVILSPVLSVNAVTEPDEKQIENSEDSMEVEFSENIPESKTECIEMGPAADVSNEEKTTSAGDNNNTGSKSLDLKMIEKNSKVSMDTDEDDEDAGLVIDEAYGDESVNDVKDCETRYESINVNKQTDSERRETTVNCHVDAENSEKGKTIVDKMENSENVIEVGNVKTGIQNKENDLKSSVKEKRHITCEKPADVEKQNVSIDKNIGSTGKKLVVSDGKKSDIQQKPQGINDEEKMIKPSSTERQISQDEAPDDFLKKGQSHTLFYHDGDGYKPVKIFIDNSEQSSLVLQRMFQTAQFSNVNRQTDLVASSDTKIATQSSLSKTGTSVAANSVYPNVTVSPSKPATNKYFVKSDSVTEGSETSMNKASTSDSSNLNVETVSVTNIRPTAHAPSAVATERSFQQAFTASLKQQSIEAAKINGSAKQTKNQTVPISNKSDIPSKTKTVSHNAKQKMQNTSKSFDSAMGINERNQKFGTYIATLPPGKRMHGPLNKSVNFLMGKYSSEGTLTRVNPDVRNKLSKALQSPQRKVGLVKSDSDTYIVNNRGVLGNVVTSVSGTASTSLTDSRQQL